MTGGFEAVPAELRQAAGSIDDVIDSRSMVWVGPGLDFGHPVVEAAWELFDQGIQEQYDTLIAAAAGHGLGLRDAAGAYEKADSGLSTVIGTLAADVPLPVRTGAGADPRAGIVEGEPNPGLKPLSWDRTGIDTGADPRAGIAEIDPNLIGGGGVKPLADDDLGFSGDISGLLSPKDLNEGERA